jgi:hypothetical protein
MAKKTTGVEAVRIFERMEEERKRTTKEEEASQLKKVTLPRLNFLNQK